MDEWQVEVMYWVLRWHSSRAGWQVLVGELARGLSEKALLFENRKNCLKIGGVVFLFGPGL